MSAAPGHFCPGCGTPLATVLRYPWYLCLSCRDSAVDGAGRALEFGNESLSGGFMFRYVGDGEDGWIACRAVIAHIAGRPVHVTEARFGGIVAEPLPDRGLVDHDGVHDLRRGDRVARPAPEPGPPRPPRPRGRGRPGSGG